VSMEREKGVALITSMLVMILISAIIVGMCWMVMTDQKLGGNNKSRELAFYGAEAGMEELTSQVANNFAQKGSLSAADIATITSMPPTGLGSIQYLNAAGASTYNITFTPDASGNPVSSNATILPPSPYAGMQGLITPFTLNVAAQNSTTGSEVKLTRRLQVVAIPVFQFGVYSDSDVAFFNGPQFQFGGRIHTNGNLWLSPNAGPLFLGDKVTAVGQVIRTNLENGYVVNGGNYTGNVSIALTPNPATLPPGPTYSNAQWSALGLGESSVLGNSVYGNVSNAQNPLWPTIEARYNGQLKNQVPTLSLTSTALGGITTPITLIRRAIPGEQAANPAEFKEQYFSEASLRIMIDDYPAGSVPGAAGACHTADMMSLDTVTTATDPTDLYTLAFPTVAPANTWYTGASNLPAGALYGLPVSGATGAGKYNSADGYWLQAGYPTILGCMKIEYQTLGGGWVDYTRQILNMGFTGRNIAPTGVYPGSDGATNVVYVNPGTGLLPVLPTAAVPQPAQVGFPAQGPSPAPSVPAQIPCTDPSPNAIIRLARVRDNPSFVGGGTGCGVITAANFIGSDFWPLNLYDTREAIYRANDVTPAPAAAGGVMYYVELDAGNLANWLTNNQAGLGLNNLDTGFTVYFSDRRGERTDPTAGNTKTGSYGFNDFVNSNDAVNGCPNGVLDPAPSQGEDLEGDGVLRTYGGLENPPVPLPAVPLADILNNAAGTANLWNGTNMIAPILSSNPNCGAHPNRPDVIYGNAQEARENPPVFFRRALKIMDGASLNLGTSCGPVVCGLTIAAENPVYIQGDFNAPVDDGTWGGATVAAAVAGDVVTFLSNNWNDATTFNFPQHIAGNVRNAVPTAYRLGVISGKGIPFPEIPGACGCNDFGTDGGVHNFLRFLENWGVVCHYRGSIVSFYYNRQAVGTYKGAGVYNPPSPRDYSFDTNFTLGPADLPPQTPKLKSVNTTGFSQEILPTQ
jgi:hypothetical protein